VGGTGTSCVGKAWSEMISITIGQEHRLTKGDAALKPITELEN
jgi:hypothetical protein